METIKNNLKSIVGIVTFCMATIAYGQTDLQDLEYGAYLNASKTLWKSAVSKRQSAYDKSKNMNDLYQLVSAQHGLLNVTMTDQDEDLFDLYVDQAKENLETLIESNHEVANSKALLSAIYGLEMSYSSWKGIYLGSKSGSLLEDAMALDKTSPIVWQVRASSKLFTPETFGGDKKAAVEAYEKAVELYEKIDQTDKNWRYLDAMAWLGQAYVKTDQMAKAKSTFEKALEVEPDFNWVKKALLPNLASK